MDVLQNKIVTTRKVHYCAYCGGKIDKGDIAACWTCVDGGEFQRNYGHLACHEVVCDFNVYDGNDEIIDGYLQDVVNDYYNDSLRNVITDEEWESLPVHKQCALIIDHDRKQGRFCPDSCAICVHFSECLKDCGDKDEAIAFIDSDIVCKRYQKQER